MVVLELMIIGVIINIAISIIINIIIIRMCRAREDKCGAGILTSKFR